MSSFNVGEDVWFIGFSEDEELALLGKGRILDIPSIDKPMDLDLNGKPMPHAAVIESPKIPCNSLTNGYFKTKKEALSCFKNKLKSFQEKDV